MINFRIVIHRYCVAVFCILAINNNQLWAQNNTLYFDHLTIKDGLSQSSVSDITKDHQGLIWIGTADGLNRYDGYHFKKYSHSTEHHSISSN